MITQEHLDSAVSYVTAASCVTLAKFLPEATEFLKFLTIAFGCGIAGVRFVHDLRKYLRDRKRG